MKGGDRAAARRGDAQPAAISTGVINTPPPTPVSPEMNPAPAPNAIADVARMGRALSVSAVRFSTIRIGHRQRPLLSKEVLTARAGFARRLHFDSAATWH